MAPQKQVVAAKSAKRSLTEMSKTTQSGFVVADKNAADVRNELIRTDRSQTKNNQKDDSDDDETYRFDSLHETDSDSDREFDSDIDESDASDLDSDQQSDDDDDAQTVAQTDKSKSSASADFSDSDSDSDSADETVNTVGNIPMEWYDDFPHIGYDIDGKKVTRPATGDALDQFLKNMDDQNKKGMQSVDVPQDGKSIALNRDQLDMLKRIHEHEYPDSSFDPYAPTVEWFTSITEVMPISGAPEPKRRFIPSKIEASRIMKIARAIRDGLIVPGHRLNRKEKLSDDQKVHDIWANAPDETERPNHIPPPRMRLPEHLESYNPPAEYLLTPEEQEKWESMDPNTRSHNFLPKKYSSLRQVPAYQRFIHERFDRCLDLYLAPRVIRNKLEMDPEALVPKLPSPRDLEPYPSRLVMTYNGHSGRVRSVSVDPTGQYIVTGGDEKSVRVWEISSGRLIETITFDATVMAVKWNPHKGMCLIAVAVDDGVVLVVPTKVMHHLHESTKEVVDDVWTRSSSKPESTEKADDNDEAAATNDATQTSWRRASDADRLRGIVARIPVDANHPCTDLIWHRRGDYFATLCPSSTKKSVQIHQLSTGRSQSPFRKSNSAVQRILFHPLRPIMFIATLRHVRVYDLTQHKLLKKLTVAGSKWISSMDIHPGGDNLIVGTYDSRVHWFDLDLSSTPYKTLRFHKSAVRSVSYHKQYPLFASCADDGNVVVFHGMVYNELMMNPLIVPVKTIKAHMPVESLGALGVVFHPTQPWVFTCGADGKVKLFS